MSAARPTIVRHKYEVLRRHCEAERRNYDEIERTNIISFVLARDEAALAAKRQQARGSRATTTASRAPSRRSPTWSADTGTPASSS